MQLIPWRKESTITAGRLRLGLHIILGHIRIRQWCDPKSRKFKLP